MKENKKQNGITLIALVVTVIVLLILAGVSIQMLSGQNGILKRAKESKEKTEIAEVKESLQLEIMDEIVENNGESIDKSKLREILVKYFGEEKVPAVNDPKWDKFPEGFVFKTEEGYEIDIAEIYDESLGKMAAGTETTVPEGKEWKDTVIPTSDGEGNVIPVPKGFYYAGGTKDTGFVISDVEDDDLNNTKGGNQFVWIPCSGQNGEIEYRQDASFWMKNYSEKQRMYVKEDDLVTEITNDKWVDNCGGDINTKINDKASVDLYGGFYVGRFEAGLPTELSGVPNYENITTVLGSGRDVTEKDGQILKPVSKKNNPSWNMITQANALKVSSRMYNNTSVTSQLIDGYAWDTIVEWMQTGEEAINAKESTTYGNYINNPIEIPKEGLYAMHLIGINGVGELIATKYSTGSWKRNVIAETSEEINADNIEQYINKYISWVGWDGKKYENKNDFDINQYQYRGLTEIATGSTDMTKVKNIYDMAGNMWEWSTEISTNGREYAENPFAVFRGGCFYDNGSLAYTLCARDGSRSNIYTTHHYVGFRVVLYIN